jgi:hypothetical protein
VRSFEAHAITPAAAGRTIATDEKERSCGRAGLAAALREEEEHAVAE